MLTENRWWAPLEGPSSGFKRVKTAFDMRLEDLKNKRIALLGLGLNNQSLAQYLRRRSINFQVIENWQDPEDLIGQLDSFEVVFRTPGLPLFCRAITEAQKAGCTIYSQTKLFFDLCQAKIIGVTGTKGKGTTATLIAKILEAAASRQTRGSKVYLAGNIGRDPFEFLDALTPADWVVLELSSFQLQDLHKSPHIAVILKITPEHLDYHETFEEYVDAKLPIVRFQKDGDFAVLNYDSEITRNFADDTAARIYWCSIERVVRPGCYVLNDKIILGENEIMRTGQVHLLGRFNLENVTAAIAAAAVSGVTDVAAMKNAISAFRGLEHRLEFVRELQGVRFYNDSFSTTPETAIAALSAFEQPIVLIAGGSEKNSKYHGLAKKIAASPVKALLAIGLTGPKIAQLARDAGFGGKIYDTNLTDMEKIVSKANDVASSGDVVLLSPASASFDMFANYKHRGELFKKYVLKLAPRK